MACYDKSGRQSFVKRGLNKIQSESIARCCRKINAYRSSFRRLPNLAKPGLHAKNPLVRVRSDRMHAVCNDIYPMHDPMNRVTTNMLLSFVVTAFMRFADSP